MRVENGGGGSGDCVEAANAPAYCLDELSLADRQAFEAHLEGCAGCRQAVETCRATIGRLREVPARTPSPDLVQRVVEAIPAGAWRARPGAGQRRLRFAVLARAAAAVLILGGFTVALILTLRHGRPPGAVTAEAGGTAREGALDWLVRTQGPDGRWAAGEAQDAGDDYSVGVSALALLALMRQPPGTLGGARGAAIRRGVDSLVARQDSRGLIGPAFSGVPYNQGLGTLALIEALTIEDRPSWRKTAEHGVIHLLSTQDDSGGWAYFGAAPGSVNTSASVWPLVALMRAQELGFGGVRPAIERGLAWMRSTIGKDGWVGYRRAGDLPYAPATLTAAAAWLLGEARKGHDPVLDNMLAAVRATADEPMDFYRMFFVLEALAGLGDESSRRIRSTLGERLVATQNRRGPTAGSWDASDRWGPIGGRVYATALAALSLGRN
jgi:hypothetical protein